MRGSDAAVPFAWRARRSLERGFLVLAVGIIALGALAVGWSLTRADWAGAGLGVALMVGGAVVVLKRWRDGR